MNQTMKIVASILMLLSIAVPGRASAQTLYSLDIAILVPEGLYVTSANECSILSADAWLTLYVATTPYSQEEKNAVGAGRLVSQESSPIPNQPGCVIEETVYFEKVDSIAFKLEAYQPGTVTSLVFDLGSHEWSEAASYVQNRKPMVFVLDQAAFDTGSAAPYVETAEVAPTPTPDLMATIEAQQLEIESLKATIEAMSTPAP